MRPRGDDANRHTIGRHHVLTRIGRGGMADVYLAISKGPWSFDKLVVLKVLRQELAEEAEFVDMFLDEARLASRLNHPNIVQTYEVAHEAGVHFLAMEYLEGQTFQQVLFRARKVQRRMPEAMFLGVLSEVLEGLHATHSATDYDGAPLAIVHRDVSPQNIFVTYDGQVKVVDFGIAKATGRLARATEVGALKGKVSYMAPEQVRGEVDQRADLFSLGVILFEYLVGRRFWQRRAEVEILARLMNRDYPSGPGELVPSIPEALDTICRSALAPNPGDRFESARAMRAAIDDYLSRDGGAPSKHVLGEYIRALFERERTATVEKIRNRYSAMRTTSDELPRADEALPDSEPWGVPSLAPWVDSGRGRFDSGAPVDFEVSASDTTAKGLGRFAPSEGNPRPRARRALVLGGTAFGLLVSLACVARFELAWHTATPERGPAPAPAPAGSTTPPMEAASEQTRSVTIVTEPPGAHVEWDGRLLGETPLTSAFPLGISSLRLSREGYKSETLAVTLARSDGPEKRAHLTLAPTSASAPAPELSPKPSLKIKVIVDHKTNVVVGE